MSAKSDDKRRQIATVAAELFAERGFDATSIDDVAAPYITACRPARSPQQCIRSCGSPDSLDLKLMAKTDLRIPTL
ncbi:TetR/AcrR family transcriptional regulator [Sphingopyxis sp.]|uniref:TetR/AcrR family transcriptional regulator n=1 Tax=Sphingopyxis sp. TaxID=1908224 RepID=UPI0035B03B8F